MGTLSDILTYNGSVLDSVLNWVMLILSLLPAVRLCLPPFGWRLRHYVEWLVVCIGLFVFQIILCILADQVGISVVWSAMIGYSAMGAYFFVPLSSILFTVSFAIAVLAALAVWIYYAVVEDLLTTIAHLYAVVLGVIIGFACMVVRKRAHGPRGAPDPSGASFYYTIAAQKATF
jgi:inner membrane protein involved in colicin E2 resistance